MVTDKTQQAVDRLFTLMDRPTTKNSYVSLMELVTMWGPGANADLDDDPEDMYPADRVGLTDWYGEWVPFDYE